MLLHALDTQELELRRFATATGALVLLVQRQALLAKEETEIRRLKKLDWRNRLSLKQARSSRSLKLLSLSIPRQQEERRRRRTAAI